MPNSPLSLSWSIGTAPLAYQKDWTATDSSFGIVINSYFTFEFFKLLTC